MLSTLIIVIPIKTKPQNIKTPRILKVEYGNAKSMSEKNAVTNASIISKTIPNVNFLAIRKRPIYII